MLNLRLRRRTAHSTSSSARGCRFLHMRRPLSAGPRRPCCPVHRCSARSRACAKYWLPCLRIVTFSTRLPSLEVTVAVENRLAAAFRYRRTRWRSGRAACRSGSARWRCPCSSSGHPLVAALGVDGAFDLHLARVVEAEIEQLLVAEIVQALVEPSPTSADSCRCPRPRSSWRSSSCPCPCGPRWSGFRWRR